MMLPCMIVPWSEASESLRWSRVWKGCDASRLEVRRRVSSGDFLADFFS